MSAGLRFAPGLTLPLDVVTQRLAFLGRIGTGKTYAAMKLAELLLDAEAQMVALDPVGKFYGLRVPGKGKGYPIPVFGGLHGDLPLEASGGALMADVVVDRALSCVLDLSQFESDAQKARFASDFAERFFWRQKAAPSAVHVFLEECLTPDTDVLTPTGWRPISELRKDEQVVAFNMLNSQYANERIERVVERPFDGELVHLKTTSLDCAVTPGHRVVMRRFQHDSARYRLYPWDVCQAEDLPRDFQVPSGDGPNGPGYDLPDDILRVLGWVITDGYVHQRSRSRTLALQQSESTVKLGRRMVDEMAGVLRRLGARAAYARPGGEKGGPGGRPITATPSVQFYLGATLSRVLCEHLGHDIHRIPRHLLMLCTRDQLRVLYEGLLEGDGTAKAGRWSRFYAGLNEGLADDFQELATRLGVRTLKKRVPQNKQWIVMISEKRNHWVRQRGARMPYTGNVYCITVPSGAFVARRNGTVFVTGNCQEFIPQNPQRDEVKMLHHWTRLAKLGRNYGIGLSLVSQRPQEVNKKVLNLTECMLAFQMRGKQERDTMKDWATTQDTDVSIVQQLPLLDVGYFLLDSPQWLHLSLKARCYEKRTADVSATPELGATKAPAKPLTPVEVDELRTQMAATVEKAKADDPKELRRQIAELRNRATDAPVGWVSHATMVSQINAAVNGTRREERARYEGLIAGANQGFKNILTPLGTIHEQVRRAIDEVQMAQGMLDRAPEGNANPGALLAPTERRGNPSSSVVSQSGASARPNAAPTGMQGETAGRVRHLHTPRVATAESNGELVPSERRILNALALMERLRMPMEKTNLGFLAGYSEGGRFNNLIGGLRTKGFMEKGGDGRMGLTPEGQALANADEANVRSLDELHSLWLSKLPPSEGRILTVVLGAYPEPMSRETLGELTGYSDGGRFNNLLGRLRSLGAIDYPEPGFVVATEAMFPQGFR